MSEEVVSLTDKEKKVTGVERKECARVKLPRTKKVYLRVDADFRLKRDIAEFYYGMDGKDWTKIGSDFKMRFDYRKPFYGYEVRDIQLCHEVGRRLRGRRLFPV